MENGIASLSHKNGITLRIVGVDRHLTSDDAEREVPSTCIGRCSLPSLRRDIRILFARLERIPAPPSVEVTLTDGQLDTLVGRLGGVGRVVIIENRLVLMYLLYAVLQIGTRSTFGVHEVLVTCVLEAAGLRHLYAEVDITIYSFYFHHIGYVDICRTRCTDTVALTMHGDCISAQVADFTPIRRITILIGQTNIRISRIVQMHVTGMLVRGGGRRYHIAIHIQYIRTYLMFGTQRKGMCIIRSRDFRREDIVIFIAINITNQRVEWCLVISLTDERNLEVRVVDGSEAAPFIFEAICRCSELQRNLHIQRIDYIDILAAVLNIRRTVSGRGNGGSQGTSIRSPSQPAGSSTKAAIADNRDCRIRFPVVAGRYKVGDVILVFPTAVSQRVVDQHRIDAVGFVSRLD